MCDQLPRGKYGGVFSSVSIENCKQGVSWQSLNSRVDYVLVLK